MPTFVLEKYFHDEIISKLNIALTLYRQQDTTTRDSVIHFADNLSSLTPQKPPIQIQILVSFTIFDVLAETKYPSLASSNFFQRCKYLPDTTDREKIFKSTYRVLRFLRNGLVHNINCSYSTQTNKNTIFDYSNNGTPCFMATHDNFFQSLYALIYYFLGLLKEDDVRINIYQDGLIRSYYKEMYNGISHYLDEFNSVLLPPLSGLYLKKYLRYKLYNCNFTIQNGFLSITKYTLPGKEELLYGKDYIITKGYDAYCIPEEALSPSYTLQESLLPNWKIN